ncbi:hypothetical protein Acr_17g0010920 [Actinidia rufa]|uniref:S-locus lectin protein kinase family protein n=1 Tax=Actinidia rufa TaxID=165716 RepID=A0A7J0G414_9ERIC|nr:hypothetical protein Acr_17g0010920 [Actinidia rufa]
MKISMEGFAKTSFLFSLFSVLLISSAVDTINETWFITDGERLSSHLAEALNLGFSVLVFPRIDTWEYGTRKYLLEPLCGLQTEKPHLLIKTGVLKVVNPGILVLLNGTNHTMWSTNSSSSARYPVAQLLESGNLVVKDLKANDPGHLVWQSFDYPGDTFLPGMKLGKNLVTGQEWYLSSWKSDNDPARGPWNGVRFSVPHLRPNSIYKYGVFFEKDEVYYTYELLNSSVVSRFILNPNGVAKRWTWIDRTQGWTIYLTVPQDSCDTYELCGPYGSCNVDKSPIGQADVSGGHKWFAKMETDFLKYTGIKMPDSRHSWFNRSMNLKECSQVCSENCSCTAYSNLDIRGGGSGCLLWFGDLINIRDFSDNGLDIYIRMASSELVKQVVNRGKKRVIILGSLGLFFGMLLLGLGLIFYFRHKKKQTSHLNREGHQEHSSEQHYDNRNQQEDLELPLFDFATIANSTKNFSINNKLGEGGFGPVYKICLPSRRYTRRRTRSSLLSGSQRIQDKDLKSSRMKSSVSPNFSTEISGYMSPEYAIDGLFSLKSDIFSFGVLVLEILSGKRNRGFSHPDHHHNLLGHAWILYKEGRSLELIDEHTTDTRDSCCLAEVLRSVHVGLLCVQQCPEDRPSMSSVVLMLGSEGDLAQPKQPGFFTERSLLDAGGLSSEGAVYSANEITISLLDAR